ncbi:restriction endonuclease subunit S [Yersinia aldovae]|uniref:restriction endonuclease subunit S n=1 Tax=Yersinia aldovae TaxID=29483 RepID=UPI0005AC6623|nr:restriction endonuclease subunit S [Yersinia aldovae]AJJ64814.1 type I restriction modification DNA specificity domain protein [Yersinia aldovae 670-83]
MSIENKVPEIRFKGFSGDISTKNLKEIIITNTYGPRFNANDYDSNGNVKTIRGTDISIDGRVLYNQVPLASLEVNFIKEHTLEDGDLVMITTADCGLTGLFEKQTDKYICSAYAVKVTLDQELASPLYFKYFFQTTLAKTEINKFIRKATVANLPASAILQIAHKIPCKKEQTAIGNYFQQLDNLINQHQQKHDKLSSIKKAMLEKMFPKQGETIPEIRFKGFSGEWEEKGLNNEVELFSGLTYSPSDIRNSGTLVLRSSNVKNGQLIEADNIYVNPEVVNCSNVVEGDIIVVVRNGSRSLIGKHAQVTSRMNNTVIGAFMTGIRSKQPAFINALLDTNMFTTEVEKNLGATINQITNGSFNSMVFMFPKEDEQQEIGNYFQKLDALINQHQRQITKLNNIKQACLSKMFV